MSGVVVGLIVIALFVGAIGLIADVVGTLFGAKKSSTSNPKSAWHARTFEKAQVGHAEKEYTNKVDPQTCILFKRRSGTRKKNTRLRVYLIR